MDLVGLALDVDREQRDYRGSGLHSAQSVNLRFDAVMETEAVDNA